MKLRLFLRPIETSIVYTVEAQTCANLETFRKNFERFIYENSANLCVRRACTAGTNRNGSCVFERIQYESAPVYCKIK